MVGNELIIEIPEVNNNGGTNLMQSHVEDFDTVYCIFCILSKGNNGKIEL